MMVLAKAQKPIPTFILKLTSKKERKILKIFLLANTLGSTFSPKRPPNDPLCTL